ncbi:MAG: hypothetical protein U0361_22665 [Nitrospiraceae bacterium]
MFGKVMSISDALMHRYYELLTTEDLGAVRAAYPMEAKQSLAELIVARYHGAEAGRTARAAFQHKFQAREFPEQPDAHEVDPGRCERCRRTRHRPRRLDSQNRTRAKQRDEARALDRAGWGGNRRTKDDRCERHGRLGVREDFTMRVGRRKFAVAEYRA